MSGVLTSLTSLADARAIDRKGLCACAYLKLPYATCPVRLRTNPGVRSDMAEYWKSTPRYWCKFCEIYVRDTGVERKNHESSAKHQNSIQRSLRKLHNGQAQQQREQQKAKDEVARLNGLVGSKAAETAQATAIKPVTQPTFTRSTAAKVDYDAHYKAQAQSLAAMGMQVPDALKSAVTGVGQWQTVSRRVVENDAETSANLPDVHIKGVHKRKVQDNDDEAASEEPTTNKRKIWGSSVKTYPGQTTSEDETTDLDVLLSGFGSTAKVNIKAEPQIVPKEAELEPTTSAVKTQPTAAFPAPDIKQEDSESTIIAPPVVTFKKRKGKR